jgi:hypothetical protein
VGAVRAFRHRPADTLKWRRLQIPAWPFCTSVDLDLDLNLNLNLQP